MEKQQCKINTAHILRQIIRERNNPLSLFREAISNAYDANANKMKIIVERSNNGKTDVTFNDNGTGNGQGQQVCQHGDDGNQGVSQGVLVGHYPFAKPLGPGCSDIILTNDLQHGAAHVA